MTYNQINARLTEPDTIRMSNFVNFVAVNT